MEKIYTLEIAGRPILAFRAKNMSDAEEVLDGPIFRHNLKVLKHSYGKFLWDGRSELSLKEADIVYLVPLADRSAYDDDDDDDEGSGAFYYTGKEPRTLKYR